MDVGGYALLAERVEYVEVFTLVVEDERLVCQLGKDNGFFLCQWVVNGENGHHIVAVQRHVFKVCGCTDDGKAKIQRAVHNAVMGVVVVTLFYGKVDIWILLFKIPHTVRQNVSADRGKGTDVYGCLFQPVHLLLFVAQTLLCKMDCLYVGQVFLTVPGEGDAVLAAVDKGGAQLFFQTFDNLAYRRLRIAYLVGHLCKIFLFCHLTEYAVF